MNASNQIPAAVFSAFVKCPTKAHLLAIGEPPPGAFFVDIEARISSMYKPVAKRQLHTGAKVAELLEFGQLWCSLDDGTIPHYVDCDTVVYDLALPQRRHEGRQPQKSSPSGNVVPVLFLPWDKPNALSLSRSFVLFLWIHIPARAQEENSRAPAADLLVSLSRETPDPEPWTGKPSQGRHQHRAPLAGSFEDRRHVQGNSVDPFQGAIQGIARLI
jgi:hypothetical protein